MYKTLFSSIVGVFVVACFSTAQAEFYPQRIYKERKKTSLDFAWKFYKGTPGGSPSDSNYNDANWQAVNTPHSASYDDPELKPNATSSNNDEGKRYQGICWYRKNFTIPASAKHTGKILIEFEGAMQIAKVWLNGKILGTHANSGFTWFQFDVTNNVSLTGNNVLAVQLDNDYNAMVPPGRTLDASIGAPDYYLFSGLYRNVWLICTDACSIPLWSQRISIPVATASSAGVQVHITTPVTSATPGTISVRYVVGYSSSTPVASAVQTLTLNSANGKAVFDTLISINSPALWTYRTPNLYYLYTQVFKDGVLVDDYVDRFGVRWYTWTPQDGFALNGVYDTLRGASLHQSIGWIQNALPSSRFFKEVGMVKQMGANLIRCAHFPRDPSFYNACDEMGMLAMVEVPTWGCCLNGWTYPDSLFLRLDSCMREMIEVGYNHPSIISWGLFNEPPAAYDAPQQIPSENAVAHTMDSTRYTYIADNNLQIPGIVNNADIEGMNYGELSGQCATMVKRILNTEYHEGWVYWCFRGCAGLGNQKADDLSSGGYSYQRWNDWIALLTTARLNKLAGAVMWCFNDYWSDHSGGVNPMGAVDHMRIPKAVYYLFRKYWTQVPDSVPVPGLTISQLRLDCDTNKLVADSTDVAIITASIRSADGRCVDNTNVGAGADTIPITFSVSGPANYFGTGVGKLYAGKCALMVKSTNTPGTITVSASGRGFTATPVTIKSVAEDTTSLPFLTPILLRGAGIAALRNITLAQTKNFIIVTFAKENAAKGDVRIVNFKGEKISCPVTVRSKSLIVNTKNLSTGYYLLAAGNRAVDGIIKKIFIEK
jgi:beta-galactosidase